VERYSYDAFGKPDATSNIGNPYLFTARRYDSETGLYYYRARCYSPQIGRFMQPDPMGYIDGLNLYRYASNNPVRSVDPFGLAQTIPWSPGGAGFPGPILEVRPVCCKKWSKPNWEKWGYTSSWDCAYDVWGEALGLEGSAGLIGVGFLPYPIITTTIPYGGIGAGGGWGLGLLHAEAWCSEKECLEWE